MRDVWSEVKQTALSLLPYVLILWGATTWWSQQREDWRMHLEHLEAQSTRVEQLLINIQSTLDQKGLVIAGRPFRPTEPADN
jgi:hypothetical protein